MVVFYCMYFIKRNDENNICDVNSQLTYGYVDNDRAELDPEEYEDARKDTLEQLNEFQSSLSRMTSGDMTLVDSFNAMQLVSFDVQYPAKICASVVEQTLSISNDCTSMSYDVLEE